MRHAAAVPAAEESSHFRTEDWSSRLRLCMRAPRLLYAEASGYRASTARNCRLKVSSKPGKWQPSKLQPQRVEVSAAASRIATPWPLASAAARNASMDTSRCWRVVLRLISVCMHSTALMFRACMQLDTLGGGGGGDGREQRNAPLLDRQSPAPQAPLGTMSCL